jgi:hypothetical protein
VVGAEDALAGLHRVADGDRGGLVVPERVLHRGEQAVCDDAKREPLPWALFLTEAVSIACAVEIVCVDSAYVLKLNACVSDNVWCAYLPVRFWVSCAGDSMLCMIQSLPMVPEHPQDQHEIQVYCRGVAAEIVFAGEPFPHALSQVSGYLIIESQRFLEASQSALHIPMPAVHVRISTSFEAGPGQSPWASSGGNQGVEILG